jgi:hypothetical protein
MKYSLIYLVSSCILILYSCGGFKGRHSSTSGYYTFQTECLGTEYDGSVTVRSWGKGRNRIDAIEQAKKEAVRTILFKNMQNNNQPGCDQMIPLLNSENYLQTHSSFFNDFFKDGGIYLQFISNKDESIISKKRKSSDNEVTFGVVIRVKRSDLREYLLQNKIQ